MECQIQATEKKQEEAEELGMKGKEWWMMGLRWPPGASPREQQLLLTKADFPGPFSGCQMTIHGAR